MRRITNNFLVARNSGAFLEAQKRRYTPYEKPAPFLNRRQQLHCIALILNVATIAYCLSEAFNSK